MTMGSAQQIDPQALSSLALPDESAQPRRHFDFLISTIERFADLVAVASSSLFAYYLYAFMDLGMRVRYPASLVLTVGTLFAFACVIMLDHGGAYELASSLLRIRETERVLR